MATDCGRSGTWLLYPNAISGGGFGTSSSGTSAAGSGTSGGMTSGSASTSSSGSGTTSGTTGTSTSPGTTTGGSTGGGTTSGTTGSLCGQGLCTLPNGTCGWNTPGVGPCDIVDSASSMDCCPGLVCNSNNTCDLVVSCSSNANCAAGSFCDTGNSSCCSSPLAGSTLTVDSVSGDDATACCGIGGKGACRTLTKAMTLIDAAQAANVIIQATVNGGGGDWTPSGERYPVVLGWGVELSAPGVFFADLDPDGGGNVEILDVNFYSSSDTTGYASIVGAAGNPIGVGMNAANTLQTSDVATLAVEVGNTLYLANATVNNSYFNVNQYTSINPTSAILVQAGATLWLGQDQSATVTGTVQIGNALGQDETDGADGILCTSDYDSGTGCTVRDARLVGQSSVVMQGQRDYDIQALDFADIVLASAPLIGTPPSDVDYLSCIDLEGTQTVTAIGLFGNASISLKNGTVQCIWNNAFELQASDAGTPTLALDNMLIRDSNTGIYVLAGTATVTNSTLRRNFIGVEQASDSNGNIGAIDLSGGGNTVVCNTQREGESGEPGMDVYNDSSNPLNASNVAWDTPGPDFFDCDSAFDTCTCSLSSCILDAGSDGMDAVEDSTLRGGIITTGHTYVDAGC